MPSRFEKVIQQASTLPIEVQDEIAEQWLEDIENEMGWQKTLQQPQERLSELARLALLQSSQGKTLAKGFDEI
ncbi:MAG: hypothetical protein DM484_10365 [Candidatus Methylumidiphilus alinenensis]|uniref:Addiction module protein n=1 Tax=Candidatus Methylumidiphilus alinenensis TaxID=2202197 RepID=A0A2W4T617_9GAMM|nr:MAG: hypothetical protein DM484_10365 [Candidatus Methylumidiphilus alinenensis]